VVSILFLFVLVSIYLKYLQKGKEKRQSGRIEDGHEQPLWLNAEGKRRGVFKYFSPLFSMLYPFNF
jgi:hypothetical protein